VPTVEALSRGGVIAPGDNVRPPVAEALAELADAVHGLEGALDEGDDRSAAREPALRAAARTTIALEQTANLSVSVIVVQVRAVDERDPDEVPMSRSALALASVAAVATAVSSRAAP
jgi:hypothetical protein